MRCQMPDTRCQTPDARFQSILLLMKKLIVLGVVAAIAAVLYKVLTTEIPITDT